jgi:hypothetical protein
VTLALTLAKSKRAAARSALAPLAGLAGVAVALALGAATLPHLPTALVLIMWLALGLAAGGPLAANAAVARGHALKTMTPARVLDKVLSCAQGRTDLVELR